MGKLTKPAAALLTAALGLALLTGCEGAQAAAQPTESPAESAASQTAEAAQPTLAPVDSSVASSEILSEPVFYTQAGLTETLDQVVAFAADTAGGSLKTMIAAGQLVSYAASCGEVPDALTTDAAAWAEGLDANQKELLQLNWPAVRDAANSIAEDPEGQAELLATAGVTTDFTAMDLETVPDFLTALDGTFAEK